MSIQKRTIGGSVLMFLLIITLLGVSGCGTSKKAVVVGPDPTCQEALSTGLNSFSEHELARLLDQGLADDQKDSCWIPLMKICLNENRDVPHRHLAEAVKTFNKRRYEALFHRAVYRYLANLAKGKAPYRPEDRLLLENYCSFLINHAESQHDPNLGQVQVLCHRLDPGLYRKFFQ